MTLEEGGGGGLAEEGGGELTCGAVAGGGWRKVEEAVAEGAADLELVEEVSRPAVETNAPTLTGRIGEGSENQKTADEEVCEVDGLAPPTADAASDAGEEGSKSCSEFGNGSSYSDFDLEANRQEDASSCKRARVSNTQAAAASEEAQQPPFEKLVVKNDLQVEVTEVEPAPRGAKGVRFGKKARGCQQCSGPCGLACRATDQNIKAGPNDDAAAAAFARAVAEHKAKAQSRQAQVEAEQSTATAGSTPSCRKRERAATSYDGRRKRRRHVQAATLNFGQLPTWLRNAPRIGNVAIHETHLGHLAWHRGLVWCWQCGCTATTVPNHLRRVCEKPTVAGERQLKRLRQGQTPRNDVGWPLSSEAACTLRG